MHRNNNILEIPPSDEQGTKDPHFTVRLEGGGGGGEITAIISLGIDLLSGFVPLTKSVINI